MITPNERRKYPRLNVNTEVEYSIVNNPEVEKSFTKNISAGGICLIVYEDILPQTVLELKIYLPNNPQPIKATGKVVWKSEFIITTDKRARFDVGIEFLDISDTDRQVVAQHIFSLLDSVVQ